SLHLKSHFADTVLLPSPALQTCRIIRSSLLRSKGIPDMGDFCPLDPDHIKPSGHITFPVFCQIVQRSPADPLLFPRVHRLERAAFFPIRAVLHFTEYQILPISCNYIDLSVSGSVIVLQDLPSLLLQIKTGRTLIVRTCLPPVSVLLHTSPPAPFLR